MMPGSQQPAISGPDSRPDSAESSLSGQAIASGEGWTLHLGDCLAGLRTLADKSVDVTITDPPYEAEAHTLMRRQKGVVRQAGGSEAFRGIDNTPLDFVAITPELRREVAREIARVTRHRSLVFCQAEAIAAWRADLDAAGLCYRRTIPWIKPDAMPSLHGRWPGQSWEALALAMARSSPPCPVGGKSTVYSFCREQHRGEGAPHPTTKPLALMRAIVEDFTLPGDLVLDPFAGSGTTGVACRQLGRHFIGWELDATYHEIACRRLRGDEAKPRKEQPGLFDALKGSP